MHIRRGDACETFGGYAPGPTDLDAPRSCYHLSQYVAAARKLRRLYGAASTIHLVTDSPTVLASLREYPDFEFRWVDFERATVGGTEGSNLGTSSAAQRTYIEHRAARASTAHGLIVHSALADLRFLAQAELLVGTSRSFFTTAALLLMLARLGTLPPVLSLEGDPLHQLLHIRGPFWDVRRDRGWFPCAYARPHMDLSCLACLNASASESGDSTCVDASFVRAVLGTRAEADAARPPCPKRCSMEPRLSR